MSRRGRGPVLLLPLLLAPLLAPLLAIVAPAAAAAAPIGSKVSISQRTVHYEVVGSTAAGLVDEMEQKGPLDDDGERFWGYTAWEIEWSYPYKREEARCTLGPVQVKVEVTITLPRWRRPAGAPAGLVASWERFLTALARHEAGHAELARDAGEIVRAAVQGVAARRTCEELERAADAEGHRQLDLLSRRSEDYDDETRHGAAQGVELE